MSMLQDLILVVLTIALVWLGGHYQVPIMGPWTRKRHIRTFYFSVVSFLFSMYILNIESSNVSMLKIINLLLNLQILEFLSVIASFVLVATAGALLFVMMPLLMIILIYCLFTKQTD